MGYEKLSAVTTTRAPKCLLLCIDVSWSMLFGKVDMKGIGRGPDGGRWQRDDGEEFTGGDVDRLQHLLPGERCRLDKCKESIAKLFKNYLFEGDMVGLLVFGGECVWTKDLVEVSDEVCSDLDTDVAGLQTQKSGTAFFSAIDTCVRALEAKNTGMQNWVVALTDGDDTSSKGGANDDLDGAVDDATEATKEANVLSIFEKE